MDSLEFMKSEVDSYHTNKILSGKGLEEDPEWVKKFEIVIEQLSKD